MVSNFKESPYDLIIRANLEAEIARTTGTKMHSTIRRAALEAAIIAVANRDTAYGKPEDNFARIAQHWNTFIINRFGANYTKLCLTGTDVALMMALLKVARLENDPTHQDSWIDLAGYAACGAEAATKPPASTE